MEPATTPKLHLGRGISARREKLRTGTEYAAAAFFEGPTSAGDDRKRRRKS